MDEGKRTRRLDVRVSEGELLAVAERAGRAGLVRADGAPMVSEYVRRSVLGCHLALDLRPLAASMRRLVVDCNRMKGVEGQPRLHEDLTDALAELDRLFDEARG